MLNALRMELHRITPSLECPNKVSPPSSFGHGAPLGGYTTGTSLHHIWLEYSTLLWLRQKYLEGLSAEIDAQIAASRVPSTPAAAAGHASVHRSPRAARTFHRTLPANPSGVLVPLAEWASKHKATRQPDLVLVPVPGLERHVRLPDGRIEDRSGYVPEWASSLVEKVAAYQEEHKALCAAAIAKAEEDRIQAEVAARVTAIRQAEAARLLAEQEAARKAAFEAEVNRRVQEALSGGGGATSH